MCGFLGVIELNKSFSKQDVLLAGTLMNKRGPDYSGYENIVIDNLNIQLLHKRLSIIDLSNSANQPFFDQKNEWVIIYNGEIYNYMEIKDELKKNGIKFKSNSDTEVIIKSFEFWGEKSINRFIGMFSFMLINISSRKCYVVRDRTGVKPLYYYFSNDKLIASSDLRSINKLLDRNPKFNKNAINSFFQIGYSNCSESYLTDIHKLEQGTLMKLDLNNFKLNKIKYWNPIDFYNDKKFFDLSEDDIINEIEDLLTSSFKYRMVSDVPVGVFLSGGYDSSILAAILSLKLNYKINTYTIGFNERSHDESKYAKQVANHIGANHTEYICSENDSINLIEKLVDVYDEPFGDSSAIPTLLVSKLASKDVKVVLSADGGDELFGGYSRYSTAIKFNKAINSLPKFLSKSIDFLPPIIIKYILQYKFGRSMTYDHVRKFIKMIYSKSLINTINLLSINPQSEIFSKEIINTENYDFLNGLDDINKMLVYDYIKYLESDILKKVDRATMYYSIEGREPLLDHRIFEFMSKVPAKYKLSESLEKKYLLKKITHKYLPKKIMDRPKMGFGVPINSWIKSNDQLKQLFFDSISESRIKNSGLFNLDLIEKQKNSYLKEKNSSGITLWYLFNFLQWENSLKVI